VSDPLEVVRAALADARAWLVGGALRDRLLGRPVDDLDLVIDGDVRAAAKRLAREARGPAFELSDDFGAWRVIGPGRAWQADLSPLHGGSLEADLALRDFTINAMAEPLTGEGLIDLFGGARDLEARTLRAVSPAAFDTDPLRVMRLARIACELDLVAEPATIAAARERAPLLERVSPERIFAELRRAVVAEGALDGVRLLDDLGALDVVLPELTALRGVEQTVYHHLDAFGHTLEVLERAIELEREAEPRVRAFLAEPLADEMPRAGGLRFAALLHDIGKPPTQTPNPKGGYGFPGHDRVGDGMVRAVLTRLRASEKLRAYVAALTRHHLRPGFLVHARPLHPRAVYGYLKATEPVAADTLLLSIADRRATRGRKHDEAIAKHLELAGELLPAALDWHEHGPPRPLIRGDDLARELGLAPGPDLGRLLAELAEAQYAGEVTSREEALSHAARAAGSRPR
jgi:tRNA nucleotidyltransferase/poly(A) polymerase